MTLFALLFARVRAYWSLGPVSDEWLTRSRYEREGGDR